MITVPSVKVLNNKVSLSSLHFSSCTIKMLHESKGVPLKISVQLTNPNTFTTFPFHKEIITTLLFGPSQEAQRMKFIQLVDVKLLLYRLILIF